MNANKTAAMAKVIWIVRITLVTSAVQGNTGLSILNKTVTWQEANESCVLATPEIASNASLTVDIGSIRLEEGVQYWTGYTSASKLFVCEGCSRETDVAKHAVRNSSIFLPAPGLCYSACGTDMFGVKGSRCYSFESFHSVNMSLKDCDIPCMQPHNQIRCGGNQSVSMFSVSTVPLENITPGKVGDSCVAFDLKTRSLVLEDCERKLPAMCQTNPTRDSSVDISFFKFAWALSCKYCYSNYRYSLREPVDTDISDGLVWTGMFLSKSVIRKFSEQGEATLYGYVVQRHGAIALEFDQPNRTFKVLCADQMSLSKLTSVTTLSNNPMTFISTIHATENNKGSGNEPQEKVKETVKHQMPTELTTVSTLPNNPITLRSITPAIGDDNGPKNEHHDKAKQTVKRQMPTELTTVSTLHNNPITLISTTPAIGEDNGPKNEHHDKAKETVKLVLYLSIPGSATLTLIVAFICCKKRTKAKHSRQNATVSMDYSQIQDSIDTGYVYSAPFDTLGDTRREPSNPNDDADSAYDVTNAGWTASHIGNRSAEGENVYKKLNMLSDDDYDHTNLKMSIGSGNSGQRTRHLDDGIYSIASNNTGNTYDTSAVKGGQRVLENEYSIAKCSEAYSNNVLPMWQETRVNQQTIYTNNQYTDGGC